MGAMEYCEYIQMGIDMRLFVEKGKLSKNLLSITDKRTQANIQELYNLHSFMRSMEDPNDGKFRVESLNSMKNRRKVYGYARGLGRRISQRQKEEEIEARESRDRQLADLATKRSIILSKNECITPEKVDSKRVNFDDVFEREVKPFERAYMFAAYRSSAIRNSLMEIGRYLSRGHGIYPDYHQDLLQIGNASRMEATEVSQRVNGTDVRYQKFFAVTDSSQYRKFIDKYQKYWGAYLNDNKTIPLREMAPFDLRVMGVMLISEKEFFELSDHNRDSLAEARSKTTLYRLTGGRNYSVSESLGFLEALTKEYARYRSIEETNKALAFTTESNYLKEPIFDLGKGAYIAKIPRKCDTPSQNYDRAKVSLETQKLEMEYKELTAQSRFQKAEIQAARIESERKFVEDQNNSMKAGESRSGNGVFNNMILLNGAISK